LVDAKLFLNLNQVLRSSLSVGRQINMVVHLFEMTVISLLSYEFSFERIAMENPSLISGGNNFVIFYLSRNQTLNYRNLLLLLGTRGLTPQIENMICKSSPIGPL
jgi:hypothetical protein